MYGVHSGVNIRVVAVICFYCICVLVFGCVSASSCWCVRVVRVCVFCIDCVSSCLYELNSAYLYICVFTACLHVYKFVCFRFVNISLFVHKRANFYLLSYACIALVLRATRASQGLLLPFYRINKEIAQVCLRYLGARFLFPSPSVSLRLVPSTYFHMLANELIYAILIS